MALMARIKIDTVLQYINFIYKIYKKDKRDKQERFFDSILKSRVFEKNNYIKNLLCVYQYEKTKKSAIILEHRFKKDLEIRLTCMVDSFLGYNTQNDSESEDDTSDDELLYKRQKTK